MKLHGEEGMCKLLFDLCATSSTRDHGDIVIPIPKLHTNEVTKCRTPMRRGLVISSMGVAEVCMSELTVVRLGFKACLLNT